MTKYRIYLISLALMICSPAQAADQPVSNQASLSASVSQDIDSNLFKARVSISRQVDGNHLDRIYNEVNTLAHKALGLARKYPGMEAVTQSNTTQPVYKQGKIDGWRVVYTLELTTTKQDDLAALVGQLQSFMNVDDMFFLVSDDSRKKTENELIAKAISEFNERAKIITRAQGKKSYRLVSMNVTTGNQPVRNYPMVRDRSYVSVKSATPPPIEAGKQKVTVSVSGTIQMRD